MTEKLPITLVVITLNEERNLARCLRAADFCSEQLVVDSGSTDRTCEIAGEHGARIIRREWTGYRDQKNYGSECATQDWVLCIDADEVVSPELRQAILSEFQSEPLYDAFEINRHSYYSGKLINHCGWYPEWRCFLYRKGKATWGGNEPHTIVILNGNRVKRFSGDLYHYTYTSIRQHIAKNIAAAHDSAIAMHTTGRGVTVLDLVFRPLWATLRAYFFKLGLLDGFYGIVIAIFAGFYTFLKYSMLQEMNKQNKTK
jgi:glycosyltransferase involved in cell wall biosynthesis